MNDRKSYRLSALISVWSAAAIAVAMGIYAGFQYWLLPDMTVGELVTHHLWHVAALGFLIYVLSWIILDRIVVRPVHAIYMHLYAVGTGHLATLDRESRVRELQTIIDGVNVMIVRMEQAVDPQAVTHAEEKIAALREIAKEAHEAAPAASERMLETLGDLERSVLSIVQGSTGTTSS